MRSERCTSQQTAGGSSNDYAVQCSKVQCSTAPYVLHSTVAEGRVLLWHWPAFGILRAVSAREETVSFTKQGGGEMPAYNRKELVLTLCGVLLACVPLMQPHHSRAPQH